jgi:hypothetical protein
MVGVSGEVLVKEIKGKKKLYLGFDWDSRDGAVVSIFEEDLKSGEIITYFVTNKLPVSWHMGEFDDEDVKKMFGEKFEKYYEFLSNKCRKRRR